MRSCKKPLFEVKQCECALRSVILFLDHQIFTIGKNPIENGQGFRRGHILFNIGSSEMWILEIQLGLGLGSGLGCVSRQG
jgi:hypothetical protein